MVKHHTGALRMGEFAFDIGSPGVAALAMGIWGDQAQEIRAMGLLRGACPPEEPIFQGVLKCGADPNAMADLVRMSPEQIDAMRMMGITSTPEGRAGALVSQGNAGPRWRRLGDGPRQPGHNLQSHPAAPGSGDHRGPAPRVH